MYEDQSSGKRPENRAEERGLSRQLADNRYNHTQQTPIIRDTWNEKKMFSLYFWPFFMLANNFSLLQVNKAPLGICMYEDQSSRKLAENWTEERALAKTALNFQVPSEVIVSKGFAQGYGRSLPEQ
jgi:hypothetical protein